jgi:hypothetical protein
MNTTSHRDCTHPATKAGRAKCRKDRAAVATRDADDRAEIRQAYFDGAELDELFGMIGRLGIDINPNLDIEEIIATL